jgi:glycosyltransferase involved in cell wall biosynthesis
MKIVHVLLTRRFAGSERYMIELANAQAVSHEVTVILHRRAAEARPDALSHRLSPLVKQIFVSGGRYWAVWQVRKFLRMLSPDVVHAHLSLACRSLRNFKTSALRIATLHICYKPQQHAHLDALIAIAPWQLAAIPNSLRDRTRQIDNWTQMRPFDPAVRARVRSELGLTDDDFLVGGMGRVEPSKGLDLLVEAFAGLCVRGARLAVVGAGADWCKLRTNAPNDVLMPGFVENPHEWFAAFDAFVSSARSEPFGLVLLEAMASGLPVLATATEGARHLSGLIGRPLIACEDLVGLRQAVQVLLEQRPPRQTYCLDGHRLEARVTDVEEWYAQSCLRLRFTGKSIGISDCRVQ